jgi:very-short-patch-repair endonuclease
LEIFPQQQQRQRHVEETIPLHLRKASPDLEWKTRFRIIAAKASRGNKNPHVYSITEAPIKEELVNFGFIEGRSFFHEHRLFGYYGKNGQPVYYWLDFYLPQLRLGIEADGDVWHHLFSDIKKRDKRRDRNLRMRHGIKVVRLSSYDVRKKRLGGLLCRIIEKRCDELLNSDSGQMVVTN